VRSADSGRRRVLVLDASARNTLAAVRALGRAGLEVASGGYRPTELTAHSRYCHRYHVLPDPTGPEKPFADALRILVDRWGYETVVATDDATIARIHSVDSTVPSVPSGDRGFDSLVDKVGLAEVCTEAGVAYPQTLQLVDTDADALLTQLSPPVVVKASRSALAAPTAVSHHAGAVIAVAPTEVAAAGAAVTAAGIPPIVQEHIARREKIDVALVRRGGRSEVRLVYAVLRDIPLTGGLGVTLETLSPEHGRGREAVAALERVCDAAGYEGLANGEFCVSARDGRLVLVEVNPRLWASSWFGERLGQRIAERCVRPALGLPALPPAVYSPGRRFHHPVGELRWVLLHGRRTHPLIDVLRSFRLRDVYEYDDLTDLGPLVGQVHAKAKRLLGLGR
jgi:predicted ATP-grasp superfamily ATP-dependent carboligase